MNEIGIFIAAAGAYFTGYFYALHPIRWRTSDVVVQAEKEVRALGPYKDGDIVILEIPKSLSDNQVNTLKANIERNFGGIKFVILSDGIKIPSGWKYERI